MLQAASEYHAMLEAEHRMSDFINTRYTFSDAHYDSQGLDIPVRNICMVARMFYPLSPFSISSHSIGYPMPLVQNDSQVIGLSVRYIYGCPTCSLPIFPFLYLLYINLILKYIFWCTSYWKTHCLLYAMIAKASTQS